MKLWALPFINLRDRDDRCNRDQTNGNRCAHTGRGCCSHCCEEKRPDARISGCVSCFGEIEASTIGSSNDTCDTQCEQYARVTPS